MAPKPLISEDTPDADEAADVAVKPAVVSVVDKPAPPPDDDDDREDEELELELDDEEDEDLVVFTAQEAAGALATIYRFVAPYLVNYKKILAFVSIGVVVETLFNVIMPLSLKFLIDDALGEEDFQALYKILGVLAVAGIFTSIVAVWYEKWNARLAAGVIADAILRRASSLRSVNQPRVRRCRLNALITAWAAMFSCTMPSSADSFSFCS